MSSTIIPRRLTATVTVDELVNGVDIALGAAESVPGVQLQRQRTRD